MPERKYLTIEELIVLLDHDFGPTDNLVFQVGIATGLRASELTDIRVQHLYGTYIKIWDEKKDVYRDVVIDVITMEKIIRYLQNNYVPLNGVIKRVRRLFNFSPRTLNRKVGRAFAELGINAPARWHTFRHTYIRMMLDAFGDRSLQFICEQTGDKPATILEYYGIPSLNDRFTVAVEYHNWLISGGRP